MMLVGDYTASSLSNAVTAQVLDRPLFTAQILNAVLTTRLRIVVMVESIKNVKLVK